MIHPLSLAADSNINVSMESDDSDGSVYFEIEGANFAADFELQKRSVRELHSWLSEHLADG